VREVLLSTIVPAKGLAVERSREGFGDPGPSGAEEGEFNRVALGLER
jgi:hypothetical protein